MKFRFLAFVLILLMVGMTAPFAVARAPLWELNLKEHEDLPLGRFAGVAGEAKPDGDRFIVKDLSVDQPVQVTLVGESDEADLKLLVYKDNWDTARLEGSTAGRGEITFRFRTGDHAAFKVTGPEGVPYQMFAWVGPKFRIERPAPFMPMETYLAQKGAETESQAPEPATPKAESVPAEKTGKPEGGRDGVLYLLLGAIVLILGIIAVLLYRGQRGRGGYARIPSLIAVGLLAAAVSAFGQTDGTDPKPRRLTPQETWERTNKAIKELRDHLDRLPETGQKEIDDSIAATKLLFTFMEHFGLIDRREAAVQPNYNPDGMPPLPSRCYQDPTGKCRACFSEAHDKLQKWHRLLEDQWVIYRQTMLEAGRIIELADAAAGLSSIAKFKWAVDKVNPNDPVNKAKAKFFAAYDKNYDELIKRLNDGLIAIGQCEFEHFGDRNWYNRYGMPYYLFMRDRYRRPQ